MDTPKTENGDVDASSKLWSFEFGWADYIATATVLGLLPLHMGYALHIGPENISNKNYFSGLWVMAIGPLCALVARPTTNTTRVPLAVCIAACLAALTFNYWLFH